MPATLYKSVDFPEPEGPMTATISPVSIQVRHRRTCREARVPKELSSARLCDPPEAQLSAGDCYPPLSALRA